MKKPSEFVKALSIAQKYTCDQYPLVRVMTSPVKLGLGVTPYTRITATNQFVMIEITVKGQYGKGTLYVDRWTQAPVRGIRSVDVDDDQLILGYHGGVLTLASEDGRTWPKAADLMLNEEFPPRTIDSSFSPELLGKLLTSMARFGNHSTVVSQLSDLKPMRLEMEWEEGSFTGLIMPMRTPKKEQR